MGARIPLPEELSGQAFRTSRLAPGLGRGRLRGEGVDHPFHGVSSIGLDLDDLAARCRAFGSVMLDGQSFSHATAAALHGAPVPPQHLRVLHVSVLFPRTPPRGRGLIGHSLQRMPTVEIDGLPAVSAAVAWRQCATILAERDLVAVGDALVRPGGGADIDELRAAAAVGVRSRGARNAALALPRIRVGAESRPETILRLLLVDAGLPEPAVNPRIDVGGRVLRGDLVYADQRVVLEYEGDGHRVDRAQWQRDIERRELFESAGHRVVRITSRNLFVEPGRLVERIRRILRERDHLGNP